MFIHWFRLENTGLFRFNRHARHSQFEPHSSGIILSALCFFVCPLRVQMCIILFKWLPFLTPERFLTDVLILTTVLISNVNANKITWNENFSIFSTTKKMEKIKLFKFFIIIIHTYIHEHIYYFNLCIHIFRLNICRLGSPASVNSNSATQHSKHKYIQFLQQHDPISNFHIFQSIILSFFWGKWL